MSAVDDLFSSLRESNRKALMPFVTAGDPDVETTAAILSGAREAGADLCEVGVPYSDPIADGPVIQASYQRALDGGFKLAHLFDLPGRVDPDHRTPMVTMASYSIIYRMGLAAYVDQA
ncbi:MAG: tryptophan synthase subunit alpha, partial [Planctomycetota bacterium]